MEELEWADVQLDGRRRAPFPEKGPQRPGAER